MLFNFMFDGFHFKIEYMMEYLKIAGGWWEFRLFHLLLIILLTLKKREGAGAPYI